MSKGDATEVEADKGPSFYRPGLDGLRVIAWALVFIFHTFPYRLPIDGLGISQAAKDEIGTWWQQFCIGGANGVPLFFALSSFLITSLLLEEKVRTGTINVKEFYLRRILRIWPLFFLIIALAVRLNPIISPIEIDRSTLLRLMTFNANFGIKSDFVPLSLLLLWSVCVEEQFYAVWPWVVRTLNVRGLAIFAGAMVAFACWYRVYQADSLALADDIWYNTGSHLDSFGFGCLAALAFRRFKPNPRTNRAIPMIAAFGVTLVVMRYWPLKGNDPPVYREEAIAFSLIAFCSAVMVYFAAARERGLLASKPLRSVGKLTYGLYCYHGLAILVASLWFSRNDWGKWVGTSLLLTIVAATSSYYLFERPFLRMKRRYQTVVSGDV